jgi:hypothetical protein
MEKTPMQELRSYLDDVIQDMINSNPEYYRNVIQELEEVDNKCIELLEKEKLVIECAWIDGKENKSFGDNVFDDAQDYYRQKFKQ